MFEVDIKGFRQLMLGRPKWHFVRELISNSLDEASVDNVEIRLNKQSRKCIINVSDDGNGFANLSDAYTLYAYTPKRKNAEVRGRFNLGEKELASIATRMEIRTTTGRVVFEDGKLKRHPRMKLEKGTEVTAIVPMSNEQFEDLLDKIKMFIYPSDKIVSIQSSYHTRNGSALPKKEDWINHIPHNFAELGTATETLPTVLLNEETNALSPTKRKTTVIVLDLATGQDTGWLFELGVPVQSLDCKYNVNVLQKIPMNVNRDAVLDSYLEKIYAIVLNTVHDDLDKDEVSDAWIRTATCNELASSEALGDVKDKRYDEHSVLWSSDPRANEQAEKMGYTVIRRNELSDVEKTKFADHGLVSSLSKFPQMSKSVEYITEWNTEMKIFAKLNESISKRLRNGKTVSVDYYSDSEISAKATFGGNHISYNLAHFLGGKKFDPKSSRNLQTIFHELAHDVEDSEGWAHRQAFQSRMEHYSGILLRILVDLNEFDS